MTAEKSRPNKNARNPKEFITLGDDKFTVGDNILVKGDGAELLYVGKIQEFKNVTKNPKGALVKVTWYYRPEDCRDGRKQFHGGKELFKSDHVDWVEAQTISGKCRVHSLNAYRELEKEAEEDFFTRFTYTPSIDKFGPDSVPVYCVCELPYNPDTYMIMCEKCEEWYHPRCIGLSAKEVERYNEMSFNCSFCSKRQKL